MTFVSRAAGALLVLLGLLAARPAQAQNGCTDPQATNYNPAATGNNGSCQYATTTTALPAKARLDSELAESSGLQQVGGSLWSHNDSGNDPVLFRIDSASGHTLQRVRLSNVPNIDWEDLAADSRYLYVGDFGNNLGNRRDLRILRVALANLGPAADSTRAQLIEFSYPDQTDFTANNNHHNFDCEAFFFAHDSLHLFTKDWVDFQTRYYTVPATPGHYVAHLKGTFNVNGLITAADVNATGNVATLLGYDTRNGAAFTWLLSDFGGGTSYLRGNKRRIELPSALLVGQVEGLCFVSPYRVLISNEQFVNILVSVPQQLYGLSVGRWLAPAALPTRAGNTAAATLVATPNPAQHLLHLSYPSGSTAPTQVALQNLRGQTVLTTTLPAGSSQQDLDLAGLASGVYVLRVQQQGATSSQKIVVP